MPVHHQDMVGGCVLTFLLFILGMVRKESMVMEPHILSYDGSSYKSDSCFCENLYCINGGLRPDRYGYEIIRKV